MSLFLLHLYQGINGSGFLLQAYEILGLHKESLLDAIMFINECSQQPVNEADLKSGNKVPDYVERLVKKQMQASWLFKDAAVKHGEVQYEENGDGDSEEEHDIEEAEEDGDEDSEWETASETDDFTPESKNFRHEEVTNREHRNGEKRSRSRPNVVFKGITLRDLLGPQYENAY